MKEVLAWSTKKILLSLLPFLSGAMIRYFYSGQFSSDIFDGGELSFSMAILSVLVMDSASHLTDKAVRDSIVNLFFVGIVFFVVSFACSSFLKIQIGSATSESILELRKILQVGSNVPPLAIKIVNDSSMNVSARILSTIRTCAIILSLITVPLAVILKLKYRLED